MWAELREKFYLSSAVTRSLRALTWSHEHFHAENIWPAVRAAVRRTLSVRSTKRDEVLASDEQASRFVLDIIAAGVERKISSGRFRLYRGVLTHEVQSLRDIAEEALRQLERSDWLDHEWWQERIDKLHNGVAGTG